MTPGQMAVIYLVVNCALCGAMLFGIPRLMLLPWTTWLRILSAFAVVSVSWIVFGLWLLLRLSGQ